MISAGTLAHREMVMMIIPLKNPVLNVRHKPCSEVKQYFYLRLWALSREADLVPPGRSHLGGPTLAVTPSGPAGGPGDGAPRSQDVWVYLSMRCLF